MTALIFERSAGIAVLLVKWLSGEVFAITLCPGKLFSSDGGKGGWSAAIAGKMAFLKIASRVCYP
jgi:hypothetical protein